MRIVAALGGNALLRRGEYPTAQAQRHNVEEAAAPLAGLAAEHELVVTHGNGPQVGLLANLGSGFPLDVLDAESEGMIGYVLAQALGNRLPHRDVATLLTQTRVDPADPGFAHPTKPVGITLDEAAARELGAQAGWCIAPDGPGWRRVVASPAPVEIVETPTIRLLVEAGVVVVCVGGGGIPVVRDERGALHGVEAVVDKDLASALLAEQLGADLLVLLTDVRAVHENWGSNRARPLAAATPSELRSLPLPAGSMGPKAHAASQFVERTGRRAVIGSLTEAAELVGGRAGTQVLLDPVGAIAP